MCMLQFKPREIDLRLQRRQQLPPSDIFLKLLLLLPSNTVFCGSIIQISLAHLKVTFDLLFVRLECSFCGLEQNEISARVYNTFNFVTLHDVAVLLMT
ncbi:hypothetical protein ACSBR2_004860 [Camellia fascicularis]